MAIALLRRSDARLGRGEPRFPPRLAELRRERSAALMVAAAARVTGDERGEGEGVRRRSESPEGILVLVDRVLRGEAEVDRDGGSELMSGAIVFASVDQGKCNIVREAVNINLQEAALCKGGSGGESGTTLVQHEAREWRYKLTRLERQIGASTEMTVKLVECSFP